MLVVRSQSTHLTAVGINFSEFSRNIDFSLSLLFHSIKHELNFENVFAVQGHHARRFK